VNQSAQTPIPKDFFHFRDVGQVDRQFIHAPRSGVLR
jgi:hypothetical protein